MNTLAVARQRTDGLEWNRFVDSHRAGCWWHREEWLDYCLAYDRNARDLSFALIDPKTKKLIALCPGIESAGKIRMGDDPCIGMISLDEPNIKADLLAEAGRRFAGYTCSWRFNQYPSTQTEFATLLAQRGFTRSSWNTAVVGLKQDNCWGAVRKSYRSLIRKSQREFDLESGKSYWAHYETIHRRTATRPRPKETYDYQKQWLEAGYAQVFIACGKGKRPKSEVPLAAALVIQYKGHGYYASGSSIEPNLQHALQWMAIEWLAKQGATSYELGWVDRYGAEDSIGFFKRGFGGDLYTVDVIAGAMK